MPTVSLYVPIMPTFFRTIKPKAMAAVNLAASYYITSLVLTAAGPLVGSTYGGVESIASHLVFNLLQACYGNAYVNDHLHMKPKALYKTMAVGCSQGEQFVQRYLWPLTLPMMALAEVGYRFEHPVDTSSCTTTVPKM